MYLGLFTSQIEGHTLTSEIRTRDKSHVDPYVYIYIEVNLISIKDFYLNVT